MVTIGTKEIKTNHAPLFYSSTYKYENLSFFFLNTGLLLSLAETHDFCFRHNDMGVEILRNYGRINYCINIL